jgi:hypothetical protein
LCNSLKSLHIWLECSSMLPPKTELFRISILSAEGFEVMAGKESGVTIFQGVNIDLANLIAGTYILKIESPHFIDAVKFVKSK